MSDPTNQQPANPERPYANDPGKPYANDPGRPYANDPGQPAPSGDYQPAPPAAGYPPIPSTSGYPQAYGQPYGTLPEHPQGTTILVLGIIGIFITICAPIAWYLGSKAQKEIAASGARYSNEQNINIGKILGMVLTILAIIGLVIGVVVAVIAVLAVVAAQPS
ncbi:MAG: hypothetical protein L0H26_05540 [Microlunatus sp.]|nr:hypothetical protein [Microlunatus sp.]